jgi:excisionase family DNA binding protein
VRARVTAIAIGRTRTRRRAHRVAITDGNPQTVRNWIDRGELPAVRVGQRRVRVRRSDLEAFLDAGYAGPMTFGTSGAHNAERADVAGKSHRPGGQSASNYSSQRWLR